ncbi:hypothetical protein CY34DRAFT_186216 [Suillus luteus UH-Slu-Lm8-n1]|uniref:Uncharacterized protein n=1 Tax=Suillus luteus UH-Slu-Lm8-n1 TaxID=930992 RepID=A0A0D0BES1_9AGAM|nr:hypothetical protein CY34DRAFT_186216 [Suillus luteus UH-Slu-Lm8-n1]
MQRLFTHDASNVPLVVLVHDVSHISETLSVAKAARHRLVVDDGSNKNLICCPCGYVLLINGSPAILVSEQASSSRLMRASELVRKVTHRLYDVRMGNYLFGTLDKAIDRRLEMSDDSTSTTCGSEFNGLRGCGACQRVDCLPEDYW